MCISETDIDNARLDIYKGLCLVSPPERTKLSFPYLFPLSISRLSPCPFLRWVCKSLLCRCALSLSMQFVFNVSCCHPWQDTLKGSSAVAHLCWDSLTQKTRTSPLPPPIYLPSANTHSKGIISLQTNRTAAHQVSAVSQRDKTEEPSPPNQPNPRKPTHTLF